MACTSPRSCEEQYEVVKRVKDGVEVEVEVKEVLYGGTRNGKPVGGARYYMGEHFFGRFVDLDDESVSCAAAHPATHIFLCHCMNRASCTLQAVVNYTCTSCILAAWNILRLTYMCAAGPRMVYQGC